VTADRGAADALALALLAPVAIGLAMLVVFVGRQVDARAQVQAVAEAAAQAAALERSPSAAVDAANRVASAALVDPHTCADPEVDVDVGSFGPGGDVSVSVRCEVAPNGVVASIAPPRRIAASATATIDRYRASEVGP
jgi:Flp pilus assembly protein TadG